MCEEHVNTDEWETRGLHVGVNQFTHVHTTQSHPFRPHIITMTQMRHFAVDTKTLK